MIEFVTSSRMYAAGVSYRAGIDNHHEIMKAPGGLEITADEDEHTKCS